MDQMWFLILLQREEVKYVFYPMFLCIFYEQLLNCFKSEIQFPEEFCCSIERVECAFMKKRVSLFLFLKTTRWGSSEWTMIIVITE